MPILVWVLAVLAWDGVFYVGRLSFWHWNISAGLFFATLWLAPFRAWPWMVIFVAVNRDLILFGGAWQVSEDWEMVGGYSFENSPWKMFVGAWGDLLACLLPAWWLRRKLPRLSDIATPKGTTLLHLIVLLAALLQASTDLLYVLAEGVVADVRNNTIVDPVVITAQNAVPLLATFGLKNLLGYFLGTMLAVTSVVWLLDPAMRRGSATVLKQAALWVLPVAVAFVVIAMQARSPHLVEFLRLLLLVTVVVFAARHGWRGAVISVLAVSVVLAVEDHMASETSHSIIWMQLFVAISGAMALMFGASLDHLRTTLSQLRQTHARERAMAQELMDAASRNVRAAEVERGRVAMELHDAVGQSITALQTQLKLVELDAPKEGFAWLAGLRKLVAGMRVALGESIEVLRPSALSELGLLKAIDRGVIRQQAERAGLGFSLHANDPGALTALDDAASVAAYRIVQEAVNNVVRHADATRVEVRLRVGWRRGEPWLLVAVEDDGAGFSPSFRPGNGLRNMRDRALMLGGDLRTGARRPCGTRVRAWLRAQA